MIYNNSSNNKFMEDLNMKKYEYVNVHIGIFFAGAASEEHRDIIDEYASRGYRYVGFIPTKIDSYGKFKDIDLIFEIEQIS